MQETLLVSDTHFDHYNSILHSKRQKWIKSNPLFDPTLPIYFNNNPEYIADINQMNEDMISYWNARVSKKSRIIIAGDLAWKRHAHFIHALNGQKILVLGNHDKMNHDCLKLFSEVHELYRTKIFKQDVTISHYPMRSWASSCHGSWCLYGHSHGRMSEPKNMFSFDVGVDVWGYAPIPWEVIVKKMTIIKNNMEIENINFSDGEGNVLFNQGHDENDLEKIVAKTRSFNLSILDEMGIEHWQ